MLARGWILALLVIALALMTASASAQTDSNSQLRRWGVGWDDGIGVRYRVNERTGIGLAIHGNYGHYANAAAPRVTSATIGLSVLVYRNALETKPLAIGPYALLGFSHQTQRAEKNNEEFVNEGTLGLGLRPTFTFWDRFVLETRFGATLVYEHRLHRTLYTSSHSVYRTEGWVVNSTGTNLGPGAVMQFMIYF